MKAIGEDKMTCQDMSLKLNVHYNRIKWVMFRLRNEDHLTSYKIKVSLGCVNVPKEFYTSMIRPLFSKETGLLYVLPETPQCDLIFSVASK